MSTKRRFPCVSPTRELRPTPRERRPPRTVSGVAPVGCACGHEHADKELTPVASTSQSVLKQRSVTERGLRHAAGPEKRLNSAVHAASPTVREVLGPELRLDEKPPRKRARSQNRHGHRPAGPVRQPRVLTWSYRFSSTSR